ncbi:MAG TPA: molybdenum cofactor guanylyltransferase, partial [Allosphingosinicella sp.]|nr:molybdenum cofactor guanylyltransferase [Allosphingosinicella sp.]
MGLAVVILAGGEGLRIGGGKPLRRLGGRRLIDHALDLAGRLSPHVAVSVRAGARLPDVAAAQIEDEQADWGPLAGLDVALRHARALEQDRLLTLPCDSPFLPADLLVRLDAALSASLGASIASSGGRLHPVCALWHAEAHGLLADYVATGRRSLLGFAERPGYAAVEWPVGAVDPFFNINT